MTEVRDSAPTARPESGARIKPVVFFGSGAVTLAIAVWAIIAPTSAADTIGAVVSWTSQWFGWFYILLTTLVLVFVIVVGASRLGRTRLGPEHSRPEFSTFAWASMLFAAGIGTDLMFFAVVEPVTQYLTPPRGEGGTLQAAEEATVWTLFHYGISGWGLYALMGMALAYFAYRRNLPLAIRSALYPIVGKRIHGGIGTAVDLAAVLGTIFGVAASLGIGVVLLNYGLTFLFGIPEGTGAQIGLVALAVIIATASAVTGVDRGIKLLSQLNVLLAIGLALFLLVTGNTVFLLNALVQNVGDFVSSFPGLTLETFAFDQPVDWLSAWTLFFWAWWIAWASFVGLFLARISRGRTIRQFVAGTLIIPFTYIVMWISIFGNSAIEVIRNGDVAFGEVTMENNAAGFYQLLAQYPWVPFIAGLATFVGLLFYVTSADSAALVMANLSSHLPTPQTDGARWVRIFWAVATGLLTVGMLAVGGVPALQNATIIMGLPFAFVIILVMYGLWKALRVEALLAASQEWAMRSSISGRAAGNGHPHHEGWRQRLDRALSFPGPERAQEFLDETAVPAVEEVATHLRERGVEAETRDGRDEDGTRVVELAADADGEHPFSYQLRPHQVPVPVYGRAVPEGDLTYTRLEVHLQDGGQDYDVMGYTHGQLIDDILDQYERHLEYVRLMQANR
ncbi:choline BCCT transporter BetT [Actinomycetospora cinnamomea]|uniref:Choline/glycine/proline betaine transport protein n=1 Tax=Actinomycetospora cinnamomea TaxID=663609 RepID=A0A2U1F3Z1_9PSEU|nr:choline BCCT transporter BetT [Actinomycetospora cinnamomea]PVZ06891.1 choline/glycine/proline betaine transport protein [Actinomycetospora cinnamomea]